MALILELLLKLHICDFLFCFVGFYVMAGSVCLRNLSPKATSSEEERSSGGSQFFNEKRDGVIILEDVKEDNNKNEFDKTVIEARDVKVLFLSSFCVNIHENKLS